MTKNISIFIVLLYFIKVGMIKILLEFSICFVYKRVTKIDLIFLNEKNRSRMNI